MKNTLLFHSSKSLLLTFISLTLLSLLTITLSSHPTSALTYQNETDVEFTINPTISVSLSSSDIKIEDLAPGSSKDSNIVTVSVSTNAGYGYYLSATAGTKTTNTDLANTADSTYKFTNLSSNVASLTNIPDNNWGYSYSTDNGTTWVSGNAESTSTGYNGLPLDNNDEGATGITLINTDSAVASSSVKFKIGAKSSGTQPSGTYTNAVNFYAVTKTRPMTFDEAYAAAGKTKTNGYYTMQDATSSICSAVTEGQVGEVIDTRDNIVYHIGKLKDGKCWLLDNLALDLTTLGYLKNGGGTTSDKYAITGVVNWTDSPSYASRYSYSDPLVNLTNKDVVPTSYNGTDDPMKDAVVAGNWKVGGYYNYCAASAGSYCYGNGTSKGTSSGNATEDICPKGWRMPTSKTSGEYSALANAIYGSTDSTRDSTAYANYRSALRLPSSGRFKNGSANNQGSNGNFWSSTRIDDYGMYSLGFITNYLVPASYVDRDEGYSVRCLLGSE